MIDTHCHLLDLPTDSVESLRASGAIVIAASRSSAEFARLKRNFPHAAWVRPAIGLHPQLVGRLPQGELQRFRDNLSETSYVVEVGIDGQSADRVAIASQRRLFEQLLAACATRKFISVHARRAEKDALEVLRGYSYPVVFHWFTGSARTGHEIIAAGHVIGANSAMLRSVRTAAFLTEVPREQVVVESDAPFASHASSVVASLKETYSALARIWNVSLNDATQQVVVNVRRLAALDATDAVPQSNV